jgi:hypothetical protein
LRTSPQSEFHAGEANVLRLDYPLKSGHPSLEFVQPSFNPLQKRKIFFFGEVNECHFLASQLGSVQHLSKYHARQSPTAEQYCA